MKILGEYLNGLTLFRPDVHADKRGYFFESYSKKDMSTMGIHEEFVQDNQSCSSRYTLRGLHFQKWPGGQAKMIRCIHGEILDVAVDIRPNSHTFKQHFKVILSEENQKTLYIPNGFAHGFVVLSEKAIVNYKCSSYYNPDLEMSCAWNDSQFNIDWGLSNPNLSFRDKMAPIFDTSLLS